MNIVASLEIAHENRHAQNLDVVQLPLALEEEVLLHVQPVEPLNVGQKRLNAASLNNIYIKVHIYITPKNLLF